MSALALAILSSMEWEEFHANLLFFFLRCNLFSQILLKMATQKQYIAYDSSDGVATISLDRPNAANAQNLAMLYQVGRRVVARDNQH